ncbi:hypothetical protein AAG570_000110 [Ranatra chinensis]|uniref:Adenomatous polyposis coli protein n=1 Tax=Ranatra chinensis TaxID=642074 RepID=A0ABD0YW51_9HEMI
MVLCHGDDKRGRREARVLRLLEQITTYCDTVKTVDAHTEEAHPGPAIAALMKLSFDEEHRLAMCQLGALYVIARLIQVEAGCKLECCITVRRYAGMALTNLTFGDGNNKALLCSMKSFMTALVAQLATTSEDLTQVTASVLRNLSWRADAASKQALREVGAVPALMRASMSATKEPTLKSVLSALWNLSAHCNINKVDICNVDGAIQYLVRMLNYQSTSKTLAIVENAGGILRNISSHIALREDYRKILREHNCLPILLRQLQSASLTVVSNACGTLWNLSARCASDQRALVALGAVPMLSSLAHSRHRMIAMGASAALKNLLPVRLQQQQEQHPSGKAGNLETPLMFSRCSSLGSLSSCEQHDDCQSSVVSEFRNGPETPPLQENPSPLSSLDPDGTSADDVTLADQEDQALLMQVISSGMPSDSHCNDLFISIVDKMKDSSDTWAEDTPNDVSFPSLSLTAPVVQSFHSEREVTTAVSNNDSQVIPLERGRVAIISHLDMEDSYQDLENVQPPSTMDSILSMTCSGSGAVPVGVTAKAQIIRDLTHQQQGGGGSLLENVRPPADMDELLDLENSILSVASLCSEVADEEEEEEDTTELIEEPVVKVVKAAMSPPHLNQVPVSPSHLNQVPVSPPSPAHRTSPKVSAKQRREIAGKNR